MNSVLHFGAKCGQEGRGSKIRKLCGRLIWMVPWSGWTGGRMDVFIISRSLIIVTSQKWPSGVSRCEVKEGRKELRSEKEGRHDSATDSIRRPLSRELFQGCQCTMRGLMSGRFGHCQLAPQDYYAHLKWNAPCHVHLFVRNCLMRSLPLERM